MTAGDFRWSWIRVLKTPDAVNWELLACIRGAREFRAGRAGEDALGIRMQSALTSSKPAATHPAIRLREQQQRVGAAVSLVVGREEGADVREPGCAEQRVGEGVRDHVAVGVADEPTRVVDAHAAEDEGTPSPNAWASTPRPIRSSLMAGTLPRPCQASSQEATRARSSALRDLEQARISLDDPDPPAPALDERRAVGRSPSTSPAYAARSASATKACGVCTATIPLAIDRLDHHAAVDQLHRVGDRKAGHDAVVALGERREDALHDRVGDERARRVVHDDHGQASSGTSTSPIRTDSARVSPPVTTAATFDATSSSARTIAGSSQPAGTATTIASIQSHAVEPLEALGEQRTRSPRATNAFGCSVPRRSPVPARRPRSPRSSVPPLAVP